MPKVLDIDEMRMHDLPQRSEVRTIDRAPALVKPEGFYRRDDDGDGTYTAEIRYPVQREKLARTFATGRQGAAGTSRPSAFNSHPMPSTRIPNSAFPSRRFQSPIALHYLEDLLFMPQGNRS